MSDLRSRRGRRARPSVDRHLEAACAAGLEASESRGGVLVGLGSHQDVMVWARVDSSDRIELRFSKCPKGGDPVQHAIKLKFALSCVDLRLQRFVRELRLDLDTAQGMRQMRRYG